MQGLAGHMNSCSGSRVWEFGCGVQGLGVSETDACNNASGSHIGGERDGQLFRFHPPCITQPAPWLTKAAGRPKPVNPASHQ